MRTHDVLVAGSGPVGLILALLLGETGLAVQVVKDAVDPPDDAHAAILLPSAMDALDRLGLSASLLADGVACSEIRETLAGSGASAVLDFGLLRDRTAHPYVLHSDMRTLLDTIRNRLAGCPNVRLQKTASIVGFTQGEDNVSVEIEVDGQRFFDRTSFLIGCDDTSSLVREALRIPLEGDEAEDVVIRSFPADAAPAPDPLSPHSVVWGEDGSETTLARTPGCWRTATASVSSLDAAPPAAGTRVLRGQARLAAGLRRGRVILAGGAAHQTRPEGEASLSAGLGDAFELASSINAIVHQGSGLDLLERYERLRLTAMRGMLAHEEAMIRRRRANRDAGVRRASFAALQALAGDASRCRAHLLGRAMLA